MKLVIVESPAKCGKIQGYLGADYKVHATMGHIRALEESIDSVGIDRGWEPKYEEIKTKREAITKLRSAAKGCEVILATDDDREGEGIAWHVCFLLKLNPATTPRIVFHEITKPAILAAVASPRLLDLNKVNAQQARAMLDLLVGFTISKVLWNRVAPRLSAGRCQSPALRLVVDRDQEVESHTSSAYWRLSGHVGSPTLHDLPLLAFTAAEDLPTEEAATAALRAVHANQAATVGTVKESVSTSNAPKPYITSTLQQDASSTHGLGPKATMAAAQKLYEAGHITYMRTDNPLLSEEAATAIRGLVAEKFGAEYIGPPGQHTIVAAASAAASAGAAVAIATEETVGSTGKPKKKKKAAAASTAPPPAAPAAAQAAHEAIRPTHPECESIPVTDPTQLTVYKLIWRRAFQSQMAPSKTDVRKAQLTLDADPARVWNAEQTKTAFKGWRALDREDPATTAVEAAAWTAWSPILKPAAKLVWTELQADQAFTKPRGRYTEASLIAELEKKGIGRPSTFASLVSTIIDREYVEKTNMEGTTQDTKHLELAAPTTWPPTATTTTHKVGAEKNKLRSTPLGKTVSEFLSREFTDLFNYDFTAAMEQDLDRIAHGEKAWKTLLQSTWDTYKDRYTAMVATTADGRAAAKAARERVLAEGLKVILSKKGPLFVKEAAVKGEKASFASLPAGKTFESVTEDDATAAFADAAEARAGELVGSVGVDEIRKKKGPYGYYAECKGVRVPLKGDEDLEKIQEKLTAKISFAATETAYERKVGDFTIKRGPYGLYFYKHALKRVSFVKFPAALDPEKTTVADLSGLYSAGLAAKKRGAGAGGSKRKKKDDVDA